MDDALIGFPKPSRVDRLNERERQRRDRAKTEKTAKAQAKRRDGYRCRFPLCGCARVHRRLESAHVIDKSRGGPNKTSNLLTLCVDRHQDSVYALHRGTIDVRPVHEPQGFDGPAAFYIDTEEAVRIVGEQALAGHPGVWPMRVLIATESAVGVLEPLQDWQRTILETLARMTR